MTQRIYYQNSHCREFTAQVLACRPTEDGFAVVLDATAFFPAGGGQPGDTGWLNGLPVSDTRETGGVIEHFVQREIAPGTGVTGILDWDRRFRFMQNHSGEHVVSGLTHRLYGYDNVGFHMSGPVVTLDFDGELTPEQIGDIEEKANAVVFANREVRTYFPKAEILETLNYRSKLELTENVRLVEIADCDLCACCAPHVRYTGEIGLIKILSAMRHRGGMRLTMSCGFNALGDYRSKQETAEACSALLSAPQTELASAVERLKEELTKTKAACGELRRQVTEAKIAGLSPVDGNLLLFEDGLSGNELRELVNAGLTKCGGVCAAFSGRDGAGYQYAIGTRKGNLKACAAELNVGLSGRGGGSPAMLQGSCRADRSTIERVMNGFTCPKE